jgi:PAS domain S-box-containing protein
MAKRKILIVEDDNIIGLEIRDRIEALGFDVTNVVPFGEDAINEILAVRPDLILMDIRLKGKMDGIQTAKKIRECYDIPVVYLTAYADYNTLERAKITEPFGYVLKPFEERELVSTMEMALYKHKMEMKLKESERWLSTTFLLENQVLERTAQLQESEQQYRTTIDAMTDAVHVIDHNLKIVLFNSALFDWHKKFGFSTDLIGKSFFEIYPFLPSKVKGEYRRVFKKAKPVITQEKNVIDGLEIITETKKIPILEKGNVVRVLTIISDITERKKAEDRISESEEKYRSVVENANEAIVVIQEGQFKFFNPKALQITGYTAAELSSTLFANLLHPDDKAIVLEQHFKRLKGEEFTNIYSFRIIDKNFQVKWLLLNTVLIYWEGKPATLNFLSDITELKKAEEEIKHRAELERIVTEISTEFINLSPENIDEGINCALVKIGQFVQVDRSYVFLFHENEKKMDNTHEWCAEGVEPQIDNLQGLPFNVVPWWMAKIAGLENIYMHRVADLPLEAASEKEILEAQDIQSLIVVPLIYGGDAIGFLGFDSVRRERDWSQDTIALLRMVGDVFANAIKRKEREEKILASLHEKEILLKEIHHRVKNNLQVVSSILYLQSKNLKSKKILNILQESQHRIRSMALVHEKLYQSESIANIDFSGYIKDLANFLFRTYAKNTSAIGLKLNVQKIPLDIETAIPCGLILNELVSNALKYAFPDERGGKITVEFFSDEKDNYNFVIKDNGIGLPGNVSINNASSLGLRLVQSLVAQLEAKININRDNGTSYEIVFSAKGDKKGIN